MWLMLQQDESDDYVIATNETHSVREFAELAFGHLGLDWNDHVRSDEQFYRPAEVHLLKGDYSTGKKVLGWEPKVRFQELVKMMVEADLQNRMGQMFAKHVCDRVADVYWSRASWPRASSLS